MSGPGARSYLTGHTDSVLCLAADHEGRLLASGAEDGRLLLHDLRTRAAGQSHLLSPDGTALGALTFHPSSSHSLATAVGSSVELLDLRLASSSTGGTGGTAAAAGVMAVVASCSANSDDIASLDWHASGKFLVAADDAGDVQLYEVSSSSRSGSSSSGQLRPGRRIATAHDPLATAVLFRRHRPWELITGGVDCRLARWDFSRGRTLATWNMSQPPPPPQQQGGKGGRGRARGQQDAGAAGQLWNPPMVHGLAVPCSSNSSSKSKAGDQGVVKGAVAVARGDGVVTVLDVDATASSSSSSSRASSSSKAKSSGSGGGSAASGGGREAAAAAAAAVEFWPPAAGFLVNLGREQGGHTRAASCVGFLNAGGGSRWVASGGEDKVVLMWDWAAGLVDGSSPTAAAAAGGAAGAGTEASCSGASTHCAAGRATSGASSSSSRGGGNAAAGDEAEGSKRQLKGDADRPWELEKGREESSGKGTGESDANDEPCVLVWEGAAGRPLVLRLAHGRKVNALACMPACSTSELLVVADTSKLLSVYDVQ